MHYLFFKNELTEAYQDIKQQGGYDNENCMIIPFQRYLQQYESTKDFKQQCLTIKASIAHALITPLPCVFMTISAIFQCVAGILHLNMQEAKGHFKEGLVNFSFGCVITSFLVLNSLTHLLSLITRGFATASQFLYDSIAPKQSQTL